MLKPVSLLTYFLRKQFFLAGSKQLRRTYTFFKSRPRTYKPTDENGISSFFEKIFYTLLKHSTFIPTRTCFKKIQAERRATRQTRCPQRSALLCSAGHFCSTTLQRFEYKAQEKNNKNFPFPEQQN